MRADLASRWQQWSEQKEREYKSATWTEVSNLDRRKTTGNLWWNKGETPMQATLALKRGDTSMNEMLTALGEHPLVVAGEDHRNWLPLDGKANSVSKTTGS